MNAYGLVRRLDPVFVWQRPQAETCVDVTSK
jgi:hypothetical protein